MTSTQHSSAPPADEGKGFGPAPDAISTAVPAPTKTPLFQAQNSARYQRQAIIYKIQERTERRLICYVSGIEASIERDDVVGMVDLLHNVPAEHDLDLLLHTGGGDIDTAEKLISMIRTKVGSATLRAVVPDYAKSAGTLMVLGTDCVVMSDTSELGAIDPQVVLRDENGNRIQHSVQNYLDAYETLREQLTKDPTDVGAKIMLGKLDPATIKLFEAIRDRTRRFAEEQLKHGMFKDGGNVTQTAGELLDTKRWQSHSQMISCDDAQDPRIGLNVERLDQGNEEWQRYWQLYCLQRLALGDREKLFESDYAYLAHHVRAHRVVRLGRNEGPYVERTRFRRPATEVIIASLEVEVRARHAVPTLRLAGSAHRCSARRHRRLHSGAVRHRQRGR